MGTTRTMLDAANAELSKAVMESLHRDTETGKSGLDGGRALVNKGNLLLQRPNRARKD